MWWGEGVIQIQQALVAVKTSAEVVAVFQDSTRKKDVPNVTAPSFSAVRFAAARVLNTEHSTNVLDHHNHHSVCRHILPCCNCHGYSYRVTFFQL